MQGNREWLPWQPSAKDLRMQRKLTEQIKRGLYRAYAQPDLLQCRHEWVLVLSHMRSGSSLLSQILTSHSQICGYGETHTNLNDPHSLDVALGKILVVLHRLPGFLREHYILDKIVYDHYLTAESLSNLCQPSPHVIFLIREPVTALTSLLNYDNPKYNEEDAVQHYTRRLAHLACASIVASQHGHSIALTYDQLVGRTAAALGLIAQYLHLSEPLREEYQVTHTVGRYKSGDPSPNLRAGKILRGVRQGYDAPLKPSRAALAFAAQAYKRYWQVLQENCDTLPDPEAGMGSQT